MGTGKAAASSSEVVTALGVWGVVLAAWAMTAASFASVLALPGVRSAMRRTGQSGQVAHGDAHVLGHRHGQGPDGGGLIDHHQQVPVIGQLLVERAQALLVAWQGPVEDLPALSAQGRGPVLAPCRRRVPMKTSISSISISPAASGRMGEGQPVDDQSRTHACERPHTQRAVPLISGHQRPAAAGDFRPRIIYGTGARHPCPQQLAQPRATRDHQQGNGRCGG